MQLDFPSPEHGRHIGKRLSRVFDIPLTKGYDWAARLFGYDDWLHFADCNEDEGPSSSDARWCWPDSRCMPLAVTARREFQAKTLAELSGRTLSDAMAIIQEIRPSDGFVRPTTHLDDVFPERQVNPTISLASHRAMAKSLGVCRDIAGPRPTVGKGIQECGTILTNLLITEWPDTQFGYGSGAYTVYDKHVLFGVQYNAWKWLSQSDFDTIISSVALLRDSTAVARDAHPERVKRLFSMLSSVEAHTVKWREESRSHDSDETRAFVGSSPALIAEMRRLIDANPAWPSDALSISVAECPGACDRQKLEMWAARLGALPPTSVKPETLQLLETLRKEIRTQERRERAYVKRRQPIARLWTTLAVVDHSGIQALGEVVSSAVSPQDTHRHDGARTIFVPAEVAERSFQLLKAFKGDHA